MTRDVLAAAGTIKLGLSEPRSLELKGVREPMEVQAVDWR